MSFFYPSPMQALMAALTLRLLYELTGTEVR